MRVTCVSFNLVVSTGWRKERACMEELRKLGEIVGMRIASIWFTGFDGLLTSRVDGNPVEFTRMVRDVVASRYYVPRFVLKIVPIMDVTKTDIDIVAERAAELAETHIDREETYKVEVRKRGIPYDRMSIISAVASRIERKVNLARPDKLVLLDMFPTRTGISVIREDDIFSLLRISIT